MKKRFSVFILMLTILVGMFGSVSVYAGEVNFSQAKFSAVSMQTTCEYPDNENGGYAYGTIGANHIITSINVNDYGVYGARNSSGYYLDYYVFSKNPFTLKATRTYYASGFENLYNYESVLEKAGFVNGVAVQDIEVTGKKDGDYYYAFLGGNVNFSHSNIENISTFGSGYVFDWDGVSYKSTLAFLYNGVLAPYGDDVSKAPNGNLDEYTGNGTPDFNESSATYDRELGYVKNVQFKTMYLKFWDEILNKFSTNPESGKHQITWDSTSTSGMSLLDDNVYVRLYSQCAVYNKQHENICNNYPRNFIRQYKAKDLALTIEIADFLSYSQDDFDDLYDDIGYVSWHYNDYKRCDNVYLQLIRQNEDGSWTYGGYLKLSNNADGSVSGQPIAPDGGMDIDSGGKQPVQSGTGVGDSYEEALEDANQNIQSGSVDGSDLIANAESLVSQIGEIPQLIAVLFSFLPPWCLTLFGVGFGLVVLLILYKLIRG